jgi:predicted ATPase
VLRGGSRTAAARQRTLRATLDWSHDLLSEDEKVLFRRLSVFAGGWTLEAAEAVCSGGGVEQEDVLDLLGTLVDKSLVVAGATSSGALRTGCSNPSVSTPKSYWSKEGKPKWCRANTALSSWHWQKKPNRS